MIRRARETTALWMFAYVAIGVAVVIWGAIKSPAEIATVMWIAVGLLVLICLGVYQAAFHLAEILRVLEENSATKDA